MKAVGEQAKASRRGPDPDRHLGRRRRDRHDRAGQGRAHRGRGHEGREGDAPARRRRRDRAPPRPPTIQSAALNAYSLDAAQAGRVSDVLANAANAAAGEISDFARGLAQASAVAAATGISLEDTAATLGILANNGIKGSDAGTLLKSALLALQSPSKQAAKAMDELGVSAYDASGQLRRPVRPSSASSPRPRRR